MDVRQNDDALSQINRLKEPDTFSVTTGHQLCLLGGPMYFFAKIIHVIKLTEILNEKYPKITLFLYFGWPQKTMTVKK